MKKNLIKIANIFKPPIKNFIFKPFNRLTRNSSKVLILKNLKKCKIPVSQIIDIGVSTSTDEFIKCFPNIKHFLFEPVEKHFPEIKRNYKRIDYDLIKVALSNKIGYSYLIESSNWANGVSTHAGIHANPKKVDGKKIIKCEKIKSDILDNYEEIIEKNCLLKIDVDGKDLEVLNGSKNVINNASIVIVEATWEGLPERAKFLHDHGFVLYDIADKCFYGDALWQCDLVFIRREFNKIVREEMNDFNYFNWHEL